MYYSHLLLLSFYYPFHYSTVLPLHPIIPLYVYYPCFFYSPELSLCTSIITYFIVTFSIYHTLHLFISLYHPSVSVIPLFINSPFSIYPPLNYVSSYYSTLYYPSSMVVSIMAPRYPHKLTTPLGALPRLLHTRGDLWWPVHVQNTWSARGTNGGLVCRLPGWGRCYNTKGANLW